MATLAMFPGQGSQSLGMGRELFDNFPIAKETFEQASDALGESVADLCFASSNETLALTRNTQPCILTVSVAAWRVLTQETDFNPDFFAGHSLGEYSALVASGKLDFSEAVKTVRLRGEAMQSAVPEGVGAMAAVLRCDSEIVQEKCNQLSKAYKEFASVQVANFNSPQQTVIAGEKAAVEGIAAKLKEARCIVKPLPVSAPFHCAMMEPAREKMTPIIKALNFARNGAKIIANLNAEVVADYQPELLIDQITHSVLWTQTLGTAQKNGCAKYVEIGPGTVLSGLVKRTLTDVEIAHSDDLI